MTIEAYATRPRAGELMSLDDELLEIEAAALEAEPEPALDPDCPTSYWMGGSRRGSARHTGMRKLWRSFVAFQLLRDGMKPADDDLLDMMIKICRFGARPIAKSSRTSRREGDFWPGRDGGTDSLTITRNELADRAGKHPSSAQRILDRLTRQGWWDVEPGKSAKGSASGSATVYRFRWNPPTSLTDRRGTSSVVGRPVGGRTASATRNCSNSHLLVARGSATKEPRNIERLVVANATQRPDHSAQANHTYSAQAGSPPSGRSSERSAQATRQRAREVRAWLMGWLAGRPGFASQAYAEGKEWAGYTRDEVYAASVALDVVRESAYGSATQGSPPRPGMLWSLPTQEGTTDAAHE